MAATTDSPCGLARVYFSTIAGIHPRGRTGKWLRKIGREIISICLRLPDCVDFICTRLDSPDPRVTAVSLCFRNVRLHVICAYAEEAGRLGCAIRIDWRHSPQRPQRAIQRGLCDEAKQGEGTKCPRC
jgi:hypothetical protein